MELKKVVPMDKLLADKLAVLALSWSKVPSFDH